MSIETNSDLVPPLDDFPFYESHIHCESWVDRGIILADIENENISETDRKKVFDDLVYAKELLNGDIYPPQNEIDTRFSPLVRGIMENQEQWGDLGKIYAEVWNYLAIELAQENQD